MKNPDSSPLPPGVPKSEDRQEETSFRSDFRSKLDTAGLLLRRSERRLAELARRPSYRLLDPEDLELCVLAAEAREEVARILLELEEKLDPDSDEPEQPAQAPGV